MHDDAAIVHLRMRVGQLSGDDVFALAAVVHKQRCIDVADATRVLTAEVELAEARSAWEQ